MSTHDDGPSGGHEDVRDPGIGSLGEEAMRLLGAVSGWVSQHGGDVHRTADESVRRACEEFAHLAEGFEEHVATGAPECTWCPVCRVVHAVRTVSPEVRTHLGAAAVSLAQAAAALLATPVPPPSSRRDRAGEERVQHIRLDDDPDLA